MKNKPLFLVLLCMIVAIPATIFTKDTGSFYFFASPGTDVTMTKIKLKRSYGEADVLVTVRNNGSDSLVLNRLTLKIRASNGRDFKKSTGPMLIDAIFESPYSDTSLEPGKSATRTWTIGTQHLNVATYLVGKVEYSDGVETNLANNVGVHRIVHIE